jgi:hypothetical protein
LKIIFRDQKKKFETKSMISAQIKTSEELEDKVEKNLPESRE